MYDLVLILIGTIPTFLGFFLISDFMLLIRTPSYSFLAFVYRSRFPLLILSSICLGEVLFRAALGRTPTIWAAYALAAAAGLALFGAGFYHPWVFRPVRNPRYVSADEASAFLQPEDEVIGVEIEGRARAYPVSMIVRPHVVLDRLGDTSFAVTYCVLCNSAMTFERRLFGREIDLKPVTARNNNIVFWEPAGGNLIQQLGNRVSWGPDQGNFLDLLPTTFTTWESWYRQHPESEVFFNPPTSPFDALVRRVMLFFGYQRYRRKPNPLFPLQAPADRRLPLKEMVLAAPQGDLSRAWPVSLLKRKPIINRRLVDRPVAIFYDPAGEFGGIFDRRLKNRVLTFEACFSPGQSFSARDTETGSRWDAGGRAIEGPLAGSRLTPIPHFNRTYWFGFACYHPETKLPSPKQEPRLKRERATR